MRKSRKKSINEFISDADSNHNTDYKVNPKKNPYKIYTFSLDEDTSTKIDSLTLKTRTIRANRSEVIRAAINFFDKAEVQELEKYIAEVKKI